MGLDMTIYRKVRENTKEELLNKLEGKEEVVEVIYWRKFWELQEAIGNIVGIFGGIENCKEYELSANDIRRMIDWLELNKENEFIHEDYRKEIDDDIKLLIKIIAETDFDVYKLVYEGWW